ncbi:unnamed protein product [Staurois parvus]|uniref:Uncharacterized protein n=1 Tax=Staurois parvus TaxID=386267 RepID=A0ABN9BHT1_9NEOB|nr:unnamed protein product [Staurois parvus]
MLLPSPESLMGPLYGLPLLLSPSPHSAMCPLSGLLTHTAGFQFFDIGCWQIRASHSCCQAPNLPWAPIYRLLMLLPGPESVMGPCTASHCCCLHRHTLPCATFRSPHTLLVC